MTRSKKQMVLRGSGRAHSMDVTRLSAAAGASQGDISESVTWGKVGHLIPGASFLQVRAGQLYCEVTTQPDEDEIVARVALPGAGLGSGSTFPLEWGCRVVLEFPAGDTGPAVITGRLHDLVCQHPPTVCQIPLTAAVAPQTSQPAPLVAWHKPPPGSADLRETTGADALEHATGGSIEKFATTAIMLDAPFVHLGLGSGLLTPPVPATAGPASMIPGVPGVPNPALVVPVPNVALIPGFGVVRHSDTILANPASDPTFFTWITQVQAWIVGAHALPSIGPVLSGVGIVPPVTPPVTLTSAPASSSLSVTAS